jgi:hypothetical protein
MVKPGHATCELCGKQFNSRQSKWMHKQRSHPSGTIDNEDILNRMAVIRERISDLHTELVGLENKYMIMNNNKQDMVDNNNNDIDIDIDIDDDDDTSVTIAHPPHPHEHAPASPDIVSTTRLSVEQLIRHWTEQ